MMETNRIIDELRALASLPCNEKQHEFFAQRYRDARPVECVMMRDVFTPMQLDFLTVCYHPERKQCYKNAALLVSLLSHPYAYLLGPIPEVKYVEGYFYEPGLISIEHAFIKVGDRYIDPTAEICLESYVPQNEYISLIELTWAELCPILEETQIYGNIYRELYVRSLKGSKMPFAGK